MHIHAWPKVVLHKKVYRFNMCNKFSGINLCSHGVHILTLLKTLSLEYVHPFTCCLCIILNFLNTSNLQNLQWRLTKATNNVTHTINNTNIHCSDMVDEPLGIQSNCVCTKHTAAVQAICHTTPTTLVWKHKPLHSSIDLINPKFQIWEPKISKQLVAHWWAITASRGGMGEYNCNYTTAILHCSTPEGANDTFKDWAISTIKQGSSNMKNWYLLM